LIANITGTDQEIDKRAENGVMNYD